MAAIQKTTKTHAHSSTGNSERNAIQAIAEVAEKYQHRALFATQFSPEDQVLAHLIFHHKLPVRVFTYDGGYDFEILIRSVDAFKGNIEVSFQQARLAADDFAERHPETVIQYESNPASAPLTHILRGLHVSVSSQRWQQLLATQANVLPFEWDETNQRAVFYPLFDWTEKDIWAYIEYHNLPVDAKKPHFAPEAVGSRLSIWRNALQLIKTKQQGSSTKKAGYFPAIFQSPGVRPPIFGLLE